jgi:nucleotide-binding universal stress UspA family protein
LLAAATREQRTRLKVFVGAAPGVGQRRHAQAARERLRDGVDVVVGVVETHGRAETEALLEGLEIVPRQTVVYRGRTLSEMDLDAILARRPELVLVDELAHTNAPGCRHPKRWLDVEELLDAGIDVYTTVNIQHLESLNDVVAQITGVRVRETIPDRVLDRADEVKLIDLSPEELIQRLHEGKVYVPEAAERALRNYFQPANLTALRELALRETAEHVDEQMRAHRRARPALDTWGVCERVLVAVSGSELSERLVRAARRMAERRGAPWLAVFVEPPRFDERPEAERERVHRALRLAEQLGGEAVTIPGRSVPEDLLRFARERNVSEIILGKSQRFRWRELWTGAVVDQVIRHSGAIDVRVVSGDRLGPAEKEQKSLTLPAEGRRRRLLRGYAFAMASIALAGGVAAALMAVLPLDDPSMVFLAAVLLSALVGGLGPSILASFLGLVVYDFFFVDPRLALTVTKPQDLLSLFVFLLVAVLTSNLTSRVRDQADAAGAPARAGHERALRVRARNRGGGWRRGPPARRRGAHRPRVRRPDGPPVARRRPAHRARPVSRRRRAARVRARDRHLGARTSPARRAGHRHVARWRVAARAALHRAGTGWRTRPPRSRGCRRRASAAEATAPRSHGRAGRSRDRALAHRRRAGGAGEARGGDREYRGRARRGGPRGHRAERQRGGLRHPGLRGIRRPGSAARTLAPPALPAAARRGRLPRASSASRANRAGALSAPARPLLHAPSPPLHADGTTPGSSWSSGLTYLRDQERAASSSWRRCRTARTPPPRCGWRRTCSAARGLRSTPSGRSLVDAARGDVDRLQDVRSALLDVSRSRR